MSDDCVSELEVSIDSANKRLASKQNGRSRDVQQYCATIIDSYRLGTLVTQYTMQIAIGRALFELDHSAQSER